MESQGFPSQHTTRTTVTSTNTSVQTNLRYDPGYVRTIPGLMKCIQVALDLLIFICVSFGGAASQTTRMSFMSFTGGFGFWFSGVLLLMYLFHVIEKFFRVPWLKIELIFCGIWTFFFMIGATLCTYYMTYHAVFGVVGFFGYLNMMAYGYDAFLKFKAVQNGEIAQGERVVQKTVNTAEVPGAY